MTGLFLLAFWETLASIQLRRALRGLSRASQGDGAPRKVQLGFLPLRIYCPDCNTLLWPKGIGGCF